MRALVTLLATGGYVGYAPVAPGTFGAAVGLLLGWLLSPCWNHSPAAFLMTFGLGFVAACFIAGAAEQIARQHDASHIVIDEIFGMIATMLFNPVTWIAMIAGFALFRVFDIIKPWPASYFDRMRGGGGVMLDDLAAGIYANLVLQVVHRLVHAI